MRLAAITQHCWFATVFVNQICIDMLVDTGSAVTLISKNIYEKISNIKPKLSEVSTVLTTADGEPMKVLGASNLLLRMGSYEFNHSAIVADLGDILGILG